MYGRIVCVGFFVALLENVCLSLKAVTIDVPKAVQLGHPAVLRCQYDLQNESLYTLKWYKHNSEFFRYTPKDRPQHKQFPAEGISVRMEESNGTVVVLDDVSWDSRGIYSCEVSAEGSFVTNLQTARMEVVKLPETDPYITGLKSGYHIEDVVRANCTSERSYPAANLTWFVKTRQLPSQYSNVFHARSDDLYTSYSILRFNIESFVNLESKKHKLKLRCVATVYDYHRSVETSIHLVRNKHRTTTVKPAPEIVTIPEELYIEEDQNVYEVEDNEGWYSGFIKVISPFSNRCSSTNSLHDYLLWISALLFLLNSSKR